MHLPEMKQQAIPGSTTLSYVCSILDRYSAKPPAGVEIDGLHSWLRSTHQELARRLDPVVTEWERQSRDRKLPQLNLGEDIVAAAYHVWPGTGIERRELLRQVVERWKTFGVLPGLGEDSCWRTLIIDVGAGTGNLLAAVASALDRFPQPVVDYVAIDPFRSNLKIIRHGVEPDARHALGPALGKVRLEQRTIEGYLGHHLSSLGECSDHCQSVIVHFCDFHFHHTEKKLSDETVEATLAFCDGLLANVPRTKSALLSIILTPARSSLNRFATRFLDWVAAKEEGRGRDNLVLYPCPSVNGLAHGCWRMEDSRSRREHAEKRSPGVTQLQHDWLCRAPSGPQKRNLVYDLEVELAHGGRFPFTELRPMSTHRYALSKGPVCRAT